MRYFCLFLCILEGVVCHAQKQDYLWLTGYSSKTVDSSFGGTVIDFITEPPDIYYEFRDMDFCPTNASICDTVGNLLFYTNGIYLANALHQPMENGGGLNPGTHATQQGDAGRGYILGQGAIILPVPESDSLYYLLHMDKIVPGDFGTWFSSEHLYCTLVDMSANNGLGKVIEKNRIVKRAIMESGKLTATRHANGRDWWILLRQFDTNKYFTFLATPAGIKELDNQIIGDSIPSPGLGQAVFSPDGTKYANLHLVGGIGREDYISVYDFDRCIGELSHPIQFTYLDSAWAGGVAFSPNSRFLYASSFTNLYQYDLWAPDIEASRDTVAVWDGFSEDGFFSTTFYLAQLAPDGKIYINSNNSVSYLHVIEQPDLPGDSCQVCQHCVDLPTKNAFSLPNFPNYRLAHLPGSPCDTLRQPPTAAFRYEQEGPELRFIDRSYHDIRRWQWSFGDGQADTLPSPVHGYDSTGVYEVCLTVSNPRGEDRVCEEVAVVVSGNAEIGNRKVGVQVYPNPAKEQVIVDWRHSEGQVVNIQLLDIYGKVHQQLPIEPGAKNCVLSISPLKAGLYMVRVQYQHRELVKKVIINP